MEAKTSSSVAPGRGMRASVRAALLVLSAVGVLAVVAGMAVLSITDQARDHQAALEGSLAERTKIRHVLSMLHEAEASQRRFLLTRRDVHLRRFNEIAQELPDSLDGLAVPFRDEPVQASRAGRLTELASALMAHLSNELEAGSHPASGSSEASGERAVRRPVGPAAGTRLEMIDLFNAMIAFEEQEMRNASVSLDQRIRFSRTVMLVLLVGIIVLVSILVRVGLGDLADRGRVEMELRKATQLAREASEAKTDFLAAMTHEIRTPLTGILGYAELLQDELLTSRQQGYVGRLQVAGMALSSLVDQILDFSKVEAREIEIVEAPFPLGTLVANCLSITSITAQRKKIELRSETDPTLPETVMGDELRLRQVLLNLLNNAVKFTKKGSVTLRVRGMGTSMQGRRIRFEVADTGIGIAPDKQKLLFRRFSRVDSSAQREQGGTGLGLAISKGLVESMGGEIGVESMKGRGSTFWFTVSLGEAEARDRMSPDPGDAPPAAGGRILLVEDAPQNQDLLRTILEGQGYGVDVADDGERAVSAIRAARYDLVLMDIQMPRMDGVAATRKIRELQGREAAVPIIAMSANAMPEQLLSFRQAGIDDHIAKPFRRPHLIAKVRQWLPSGCTGAPAAPANAAADHDRAAFEELRGLMGDDWVRANLLRLKERIEEALIADVGGAPDREQLRRRAHRIAADAGQLGFVALSRCCSALEEACVAEDDTGPPLSRTRRTAETARAIADRLMAETSPRARSG